MGKLTNAKEGAVNLPKVYFFDLDRTLVKGNITFKLLIHYFLSHPYLTLARLSSHLNIGLQYLTHPKDLKSAHALISILMGHHIPELLWHSKGWQQKVIEKAVYLPVYQEMMRALHLGHRVMILSAAPDFIVQLVLHTLGDLEGMGTEYNLMAPDQLKIVKIMNGREKASTVMRIKDELGIDKDQLVAYSDSINDLALLAAVGEPVVVNGDKKILKIAQEENWRTIP